VPDFTFFNLFHPGTVNFTGAVLQYVPEKPGCKPGGRVTFSQKLRFRPFQPPVETSFFFPFQFFGPGRFQGVPATPVQTVTVSLFQPQKLSPVIRVRVPADHPIQAALSSSMVCFFLR